MAFRYLLVETLGSASGTGTQMISCFIYCLFGGSEGVRTTYGEERRGGSTHNRFEERPLAGEGELCNELVLIALRIRFRALP